MDNKEIDVIVDKLKSFIDGSNSYAGVTFRGMYTMDDDIFLIAFSEYLRSGVNHLDEYSKIIQLGWDLPDDNIRYSQREIDEYRKYIQNKGFWEISGIYSEIEIKEIDLMLAQQQLRINRKKLLLEKTDYRNTIEYKEWRTAVFERDNYTCRECNQKGVELNAHHILSFKKHPKQRYEISNGITVCVNCHRKNHLVNE